MTTTYAVSTSFPSDLSRVRPSLPPIKAVSPFQAAVNAARFLGWDSADPKLVAREGDARVYETATMRFIVAAA